MYSLAVAWSAEVNHTSHPPSFAQSRTSACTSVAPMRCAFSQIFKRDGPPCRLVGQEMSWFSGRDLHRYFKSLSKSFLRWQLPLATASGDSPLFAPWCFICAAACARAVWRIRAWVSTSALLARARFCSISAGIIAFFGVKFNGLALFADQHAQEHLVQHLHV